jgi:hypothetical protein
LLGEKNTVPAEKTSWKVRITRQANMEDHSLFPKSPFFKILVLCNATECLFFISWSWVSRRGLRLAMNFIHD